MSTQKNKYIVGVTGGIGSGKTTVTNMFKNKGIEVVDADVVAREVVIPGSEGLQQLVAHFGESILNDTGDLNRALLREIVFSDPQAKQTLNHILHPLIRQKMLNQLQNTRSQYCILSAPLLFENNLHTLVNRSAVVDIEEHQQLTRTMSRDGGNQKTIQGIINAQVSRTKRLSLADDVIDNTQGINKLVEQVENLHQQYLALSA